MSIPRIEHSSSFDAFGLDARILRGISSAGYERPRPIQAQAIPPTLDGRDCLGLARTGTGKTAAFSLPLLQRLSAKRARHPRGLILAPTRELASQIHAELGTLGRFTDCRSATVFGGVSVASQIRSLRARPDVIVACPGRLLDLMTRGLVRLDHVEMLVLDEADHMFDMGFLPDVRRIVAAVPQRRVTLMFAATMSPEIRKLADRVLDDPIVIDVREGVSAPSIEHAALSVTERQKDGVLQKLLSTESVTSAIVFARTKRRSDKIAKRLATNGHRATALHGNMSQGQRERAMRGFRGRDFDVLVATDIAARGIDVEQVSHVFNYDMPTTLDAFTHRVGRTGRADRRGMAFTLVSETDTLSLKEVERRLGIRIPMRTVGRPGSAKEENVESRPPRGLPGPNSARSSFKGRRTTDGSKGSRGKTASGRRRRRRRPSGE